MDLLKAGLKQLQKRSKGGKAAIADARVSATKIGRYGVRP